MSPLQPLQADSLQSITLIATDMDGTLTQAGKFSAQLLQALESLATAGLPVLIVTGRSAGWVSGLAHYLPIVGAIAENGGLFYPAESLESAAAEVPESGSSEFLIDLPDPAAHRQQLAQMFQQLQASFPAIRESTDNRFRITDWTFDVAGLSQIDLDQMATLCRAQGWGFTYSTVQCHIFPAQQNKAAGLRRVLERYFPQHSPQTVLTIGDSPNDESLFDPNLFSLSVGVANLRHYLDQIKHQPAYITQAEAVAGFCEVVQALVR